MRLAQGEGHGGVDGEGHGWLPACGGSEVEQIAGDDDSLDLAGSLDDLDLLGVAHEALEGVVFHVARPPEDLDAVDGGLHGHVRGIALGGRDEMDFFLTEPALVHLAAAR